MTAAESAEAVRRGAGLFQLAHRGVIRVEGGDALRWLNGMVSGDVAALDPEAAGHCHALLLTPIGRIAAELHVVARPQGFWLELERDVVAAARERLEKYVIADDVTLADAGDEIARLGVEGPQADAVWEAARAELDALGAVAVAFGWSGERAWQLFVPAAGRAAALVALRAAGEGRGLVEADLEALEILRVESGTPRQGLELDEEVLPPEARLDAAVSTTKGCYTGQEVIARIASRGQVKHLLVGLRFEGATPAAVGEAIEAEGRRVGEVTSAVLSPRAGAIALGFVRRPHDAPGTPVRVAGRAATISELSFVPGGP